MVIFLFNVIGFGQTPSRLLCVFSLKTYYLHSHSYQWLPSRSFAIGGLCRHIHTMDILSEGPVVVKPQSFQQQQLGSQVLAHRMPPVLAKPFHFTIWAKETITWTLLPFTLSLWDLCSLLVFSESPLAIPFMDTWMREKGL